MIVHSSETVSLIGGASFSAEAFARVTALAPCILAADGGADAVLAHGAVPEAVIGDFDSISDAARASLPDSAQHRIEEQDSTDFDKCLRNIHAPLILGLGFSGDRLDHQLATYNSLVRHPDRRCILLGRQELVFLAPPQCRLDLEEDTVVSLYPMGAVEGISDGLQWEIGGLNFAPDGRVGTSNRAKGPVHLNLTSPKMLVILPETALEIAVRALLESAAHWEGAAP